MAASLNETKQLFCPYERAHQILFNRMQGHLVKCRKNHPDAEIVECRLNATHRVPQPELDFHMTYECPDRKKLEKHVYVADDATLFPVQPVDVACSENWETDSFPTYDPNAKCERDVVVRKLAGATPSERKAFRAQERLRLQSIENTPSQLPAQSSKLKLRTKLKTPSQVETGVKFVPPIDIRPVIVEDFNSRDSAVDEMVDHMSALSVASSGSSEWQLVKSKNRVPGGNTGVQGRGRGRGRTVS